MLLNRCPGADRDYPFRLRVEMDVATDQDIVADLQPAFRWQIDARALTDTDAAPPGQIARAADLDAQAATQSAISVRICQQTDRRNQASDTAQSRHWLT